MVGGDGGDEPKDDEGTARVFVFGNWNHKEIVAQFMPAMLKDREW